MRAAEPEALSHGPLSATVKPEPSAATGTSQLAAETSQSLHLIYTFCLSY